jgi:uncharacterized membrane protein YkvA (DUF1232 family)
VIEPRDPQEQTRLKELVLLLPNMAKLVARLARDPRVPARTKATLVLVAGYLLSPIDLVPSFVPGLGQLDDLVIAALALNQLLNEVPAEVVREHWDGEPDVLEVVQEVLRQGTSLVPARLRRIFSSQ